MISYFDEQIGQLIEKLKAEHLYENTLIVFTSDNGPTFNGGSDSPWFNSGGLFNSAYGWGKCFLHEGGIRVPAIITWPGKIKPGTQSDHICAFQDVMPTLAELAGITCPPTDGISFLPTLLGKKGNKKNTLIYIGNILTQGLATKQSAWENGKESSRTSGKAIRKCSFIIWKRTSEKNTMWLRNIPIS